MTGFCGARRRQQPPDANVIARCKRPAGWGTATPGVGVCRTHGGNTPSHRVRAAALRVEHDAEAALRQLAEGPIVSPGRVSPAEALMGALTEATIVTAYLRRQVQAQLGDEWTGDVLSLTKDGFPVPVSEDARALVKLYERALDRQAKLAKAAHEAGVQEAALHIEQTQWRTMAEVVHRVLMRTLDPEQRATVERALGTELRQLADVAPVPALRGAT